MYLSLFVIFCFQERGLAHGSNPSEHSRRLSGGESEREAATSQGFPDTAAADRDGARGPAEDGEERKMMQMLVSYNSVPIYMHLLYITIQSNRLLCFGTSWGWWEKKTSTRSFNFVPRYKHLSYIAI